MGKPKLEWIRNIEFTEDQQSLVAEVLSFVNDIGLPDHLDQSVFDEVLDKVTQDSPFEWSCTVSYTHLTLPTSDLV